MQVARKKKNDKPKYVRALAIGQGMKTKLLVHHFQKTIPTKSRRRGGPNTSRRRKPLDLSLHHG